MLVHAFEPSPVPLAEDEHGVVRVAGTRVTLDVVLSAFEAGATAEEIAQQYPTLPLDAIYTVLTWILHHGAEVASYVARRKEETAELRTESERRHPPVGIRERLLARARR